MRTRACQATLESSKGTRVMFLMSLPWLALTQSPIAFLTLCSDWPVALRSAKTRLYSVERQA